MSHSAETKAPKRPAKQAPQVPPAEYRSAVDAAYLRNVRLVKSEFFIEPEGVVRDRSNWRQLYEFAFSSAEFDATRKILSSWIAAEAVCKVGRKRVVFLRCQYLVAYSVEGAPTEEAAVMFAARVAPFTAYPYFRAHFAEVCSQAGLNLPPLPVMKEGRRPISATAKKSG